MIDAIQATVPDRGTTEVVGKTLIWTALTAQSQSRQLTVSVRSRHGKSRIVIEESLQSMYVGLFVIGLGFGLGSLSLVLPVALALHSRLFGMMVAVGMAFLSVVLASLTFRAIAARRAKQLGDLRQRLCEVVRESSTRHAVARIAAGTEPAAEEAADEEAEADAAAQAGEARSTGTRARR